MNNLIQEFDWSATNRKLCVFIPHFKRPKHLALSLSNLPITKRHYDIAIIIGNDCVDNNLTADNLHNISEKINIPIYQFTVDREASSRNGCFIRNYFIKRCLSEYILFKDPEIILSSQTPDMFADIIDSVDDNSYVRAKHVCMLPEQESKKLMDSGKCFAEFEEIDPDKHFHIHHCLCVQTQLLKDIRGYNEKIYLYGPEDRDMFYRLNQLGLRQITLPIYSLHAHHDRDPISYSQELWNMEKICNESDWSSPLRNDENWGESI